jgi:hypothetical protein
MKTVKKTETQKAEKTNPVVKSFSKFRNARMVRIEGSFMGGGFNISQNKIKAILANIEVLQNFANGDYDKQIDELKDDEILEV